MKISILLAFLALALPLRAGEEKHPIDRAMDAAMDKDPSTAGMVQAVAQANKQWDRKMNAIYQDLNKAMVPEEWAALVIAQKAWVVYRDAQTKSLVETYGRMEGTMWIPASASAVMDLTRERALFLQSLKDTLSER